MQILLKGFDFGSEQKIDASRRGPGVRFLEKTSATIAIEESCLAVIKKHIRLKVKTLQMPRKRGLPTACKGVKILFGAQSCQTRREGWGLEGRLATPLPLPASLKPLAFQGKQSMP
jgi:hypothetical protein